MNRRLVGYTLMFGIIYFYFKHNEEKKVENIGDEVVKKKESIEKNVKKNIFEIPKNDEVIIKSEKKYILENNEIKVVLSNIGARIKTVELKNYKNYLGKNVVLFSENSSSVFFTINYDDKNILKTDSILFNTIKEESNKIEFEYINERKEKIISIFELDEKKPFIIRHSCNIINSFENNKVNMSIVNLLHCHETNLNDCCNKSTIKFLDINGKVSGFNEIIGKEEKQVKQDLKWLSWKQKFFTTGMALKNNKNSVDIVISPGENDVEKKTFVDINFTGVNKNIEIDYYFGPNKFNSMASFAENFDQNVYYGIPGVRVFNKYVLLPMTNFLDSKGINAGLIIIILVLFLKLLLLPLNLKSYKMMAKMKILTPLLKSLNDKYGNNKQQLAFEQLKLYREYGVNPLGSLLPIFLQFPFLIAMFNFIPISFVFRGKSFLWCNDMSTFDSIIKFGFSIPFYGDHLSLFALLMTLTTLLYTLYSNKSSGMSKGSLIMMIFFPLFFLGISNRFCAALNFYYLIFNIITLIIQHFMKYFINEEEIMNKVHNSISTLKKSDKNFSKQFLN